MDEDVDRRPLPLDLVGERAQGGIVGEVRRVATRIGAGLRRRLLEGGEVPADEAGRCAGLAEALGDPAADATPGAGHDRGPTAQRHDHRRRFHARPPDRRTASMLGGSPRRGRAGRGCSGRDASGRRGTRHARRRPRIMPRRSAATHCDTPHADVVMTSSAPTTPPSSCARGASRRCRRAPVSTRRRGAEACATSARSGPGQRNRPASHPPASTPSARPPDVESAPGRACPRPVSESLSPESATARAASQNLISASSGMRARPLVVTPLSKYCRMSARPCFGDPWTNGSPTTSSGWRQRAAARSRTPRAARAAHILRAPDRGRPKA